MNKDISASEVSGNKASDHIVEVNDMVKIGSSTERVMDNGRAYLFSFPRSRVGMHTGAN